MEILKKKWVWIVGALVFFCIIGMLQEKNEPKATNKAQTEQASDEQQSENEGIKETFPEDVVAVYELKDDKKKNWRITLKNDGTGIVTGKKTNYFSWSDESDRGRGLELNFSGDNVISFPIVDEFDKYENYGCVYILGDWMYRFDGIAAKDPRKRLSVKKIH